MTARPKSHEERKARTTPNLPHEKAADPACTSVHENSLQCAIDDFFGKTPPPVPFHLGENKGKVRFVIATVPDPVHTDLALSFDRYVEAISQGAQEAGYIFDHAVLPWPTPGGEPKETKEDASARAFTLEKENTPGLLIFRKSNPDSNLEDKHLLILLVGETPTAGIHKEQFLRAVEIISQERDHSTPLRIDLIGPTFSGSLYSLVRLEELAKDHPAFRIRSGTVMSGHAVDDFLKLSSNKDFLTFKDTDTYLIDRLVAFVQKDGLEGYEADDIALLSEDETAFGSLSNPGVSGCYPAQDGQHCLLRIYFPRGISQLRSAYEDDPVLASGSGSEKTNAPHTKLKLELESTGSDEDSVPTYAGRQTAISQEAVMMGMVTVLRTHKHRFLVVRATDPKDLLFLTRFLRTNFPQDRIITIGADQLFPRDINDTIFRGVLSLTNYPLLPRQLTDFEPPQPHRVFASTECASLFNATLAILQPAETETPSSLPQANYFEYTPPIFDKNSAGSGSAVPAAWLTVMGDDGYWPLATLPPPVSPSVAFSDSHPYLCRILSQVFPHACASSLVGAPSTLRPANTSLPNAISLQPSIFNQLVITVLLIFAALFIYLTWFGDFKSRSTFQQQLSLLDDQTRGTLLGIIGLVLVVAFVLLGSPISKENSWLPWAVILGAIATAVSTGFNVRARGHQRFAVVVAISSVLLMSPLLWITRSHHSINENLVLYRMAWLQSGVSPSLPLLMVCGALFCWTWYNLQLRSLFDRRRPVLPRGVPFLPSEDERGPDEYANVLSHSRSFWVIVTLVIAVLLFQDMDPLSLDGTNFDDLYRLFFMVGVVLIANSTFNAWTTWKKCRALLLQIDRSPLRWGFARLEGFSWKPLWGMSGGDLMNAYKPLSRSLEALAHLRASLGVAPKPTARDYVQARAGLVDQDLGYLRNAFAKPTISARTHHLRKTHDDLIYRIQSLQKNLAIACSLVWFAVLENFWRNDVRLVAAGKGDNPQSSDKAKAEASEKPESNLNQPDDASGPVETQSTRLAEEFISLVYLNFIHRVLLRLRWLILAATSAYVLLLFSAKLYPFEPHGHIDGLLILMFAGVASVIYLIYAEMHRDSTLSNLTKTTPGELGGDFWLQIIGIGAVPVFSLLATQVPALSRFLFQWLKPVVDAVHRG